MASGGSFFLAAVLLALGGGGACGGDGPPDRSAPTVSIIFPPPVSGTDAATIRIRATASDDRKIASVRVNGVDATSDDHYATWTATVPLIEGGNTLVVEVEDRAGNVGRNHDHVVTRGLGEAVGGGETTNAFGPQTVAIDPGGEAGYVVGTGTFLTPALILYEADRVDLATGDRSVVASGANFAAAPVLGVTSTVLDTARNRLLATDVALDGFIGLDLANQLVSLYRSPLTPLLGPPLENPTGLALDVDGDRIFSADRHRHAPTDDLVAIDLASGVRSVVSDASHGSGPAFSDARSVARDLASGRVFVLSATDPYLVVVDPNTGDRMVPPPDGSGPALKGAQQVSFDPVRQLAFATDIQIPGLVAIDPLSGTRRIVSSNSVGIGPQWSTDRGGLPEGCQLGLAIHPTSGLAYIADVAGRRLLAVDPETGDRVVASQEAGNGK